MTPTRQCRHGLIEQFLSGKISPTALAELELHLSDCAECESELNRKTAEPQFWQDAKSFLDTNEELKYSTVRTAQGDLSHVLSLILHPTDDPRMLGRFGGYEICGVVGRGGMGIVLKGLDVSLDRFVAIKVLDPSYSVGSAARQRFVREAQAAAAVVHDNVISIYGVDHSNRFPFLVMPYIKGESLQQRIDRTAPLAIEDVLRIGMQIARGLAAAHDQGLVHRDIKPANILLPASVARVIITDFGLARAADDASLTRSGVIAGTPQYMSPEQVAGEPVDGRTDLFSLGSVMYAMVCGHPPFRAETPYGVMRRITDHDHRPLSQLCSETPVWLERIIDRLLQKAPSQRFSTATEVADHLEDCLAHIRQPTTVMLPKIKPLPKAKQRSLPLQTSRELVGMLLAAGVVLVAFLIVKSSTLDSTIQATNPTQVQAADPYMPALDDRDLLRLESDLDQLWQDIKADPFAPIVP